MAVTGAGRLAAPLVIRLFGGFEAQLGDAPLPRLRSRKGRWLFALLVLKDGHAVERSWLAGTLWPDSSEPQAAYNLRRNLTDLRHALGAEARRLRSPTPRTLRLDLEGAEADVIRFDEAIARGDGSSLEEAVSLNRGLLLEGCAEDWVLQEREAREQALLAALETLAAHAAGRGDHAASARYLRRAIAADPLREGAQRALMQALAAVGDYAAATLVYRELRLLLHRELNAQPAPETTALFRQIRAEARRGATADQRPTTNGNRSPTRTPTPQSPIPSPRSQAGRPPCPLSSFLGRERELDEIETCLLGTRLVTLTGPGGIGKTRLAIQVADELAEEYGDGVWFVDLAALSDPTLVPQSAASALDVREQPGRALTETLVELLRPKQRLLVVDNCEHLIAAVSQLVEALLRGCPHLRILATSRQSLGLPGEAAWRVPPLAAPDPARIPAGPDGEKDLVPVLMEYAAIRLFAERARQAYPDFKATPDNIRALAQVCHRLDGIPLALELVAARLKAMTVEQIAARLDDRLSLLDGSSRTALPRQQTLRATMDWSFELLSEPELALLRRLSVFVGGFTLEAAEAVCSDGEAHCKMQIAKRKLQIEPTSDPSLRPTPYTLHPHDVLDLLTSLVDKSLVIYEDQGAEARYRLLETVRQYARERLRERGEEEEVRDRHTGFFLRLAEAEAPSVARGERGLRLQQLQRLEAEHDNLRAALEWSRTVAPSPGESLDSRAEVMLRLTVALGAFWVLRGFFNEGSDWLGRAVAMRPDATQCAARAEPSSLRARALFWAGRLAHDQGRYEAARAWLEASLAVFTEVGDRTGIAAAKCELGWATTGPGQTGLLEEGLDIYRDLGDRGGAAWALERLCFRLGWQEDIQRATSMCEESLSIERELGPGTGLAWALNLRGILAASQGDAVWARSLFQESLAIHGELGNTYGQAFLLENLGDAARSEGDAATARLFFEQSLDKFRQAGARSAVANVVRRLGHLALAEGDPSTARAFHAESLALWWELGDKQEIAFSLLHLGDVAQAQGDEEVARRFREESLAIRRELGEKPGMS